MNVRIQHGNLCLTKLFPFNRLSDLFWPKGYQRGSLRETFSVYNLIFARLLFFISVYQTFDFSQFFFTFVSQINLLLYAQGAIERDSRSTDFYTNQQFWGKDRVLINFHEFSASLFVLKFFWK